MSTEAIAPLYRERALKMKNRLLYIILFLQVIFIECSSYIAPNSSPLNSFVFTRTEQHVYGLSHGSQLTSGKILRYGESCSFSSAYISLFYYGSGGSIEEAKRNAGITRVAVIDRKSMSIFYNLFYEECIIVWGE
jgi:TRL-like protein family